MNTCTDVGYFKLAHPTTVQVFIRLFNTSILGGVGSNPTAATKCEVSRVRAMLLMSVACNFFVYY